MNHLKIQFIAILCLFAAFTSGAKANDVVDVRLSGNAEKTRLVIELNEQVAFKVYNISEPERLIIDFDIAQFKIAPTSGSEPYGLVKEYRYGNFSPTKSRIVLDTYEKTSVVAAFIVPPKGNKGALLVVDIVKQSKQQIANKQQTNEANVNRSHKQSLPQQNLAQQNQQRKSELGFDASLAADPKAIQLDFRPNIPSIDELIDFQPDIPSIDELMRTASNDASLGQVGEQSSDGTSKADSSNGSNRFNGSNIRQSKVDLSSLEDDTNQTQNDTRHVLNTIEPPVTNRVSIVGVVPKPISRPDNYQQIILASRNIVKDKQQLIINIRKPVIVLDAGHGGIDGGTVSLRGTREKNVVLAFAKRLQKKLLASGKYKVYLTRKGDYFIKLRDRVKISQKHKADLFISLHADSVPGRNSSARGASIYTLSDKASDKEAAALARKENKSDIVAGVQFKNESKVVVSILIDLAQRDTKSKSIKFANYTAGSMRGNVIVRKRPIKFGNLRVLKAPDIPSVLIELGYLSNKKDENNLKSANWQNKMAASITRSVGKYFKNRTLF